MVFYGEYRHTIDSKGRIFIPSDFREELGEQFMIAKGIEGKRCLCVYSMDAWAKLDEQIQSLPNMKASAVKRFLYVGAKRLEPDGKGRILIPQPLREFADLNEEAAVLGMSKRLEIWNTALWEKENEQYTPESVASIMEGLDY